jgi:hypothetical protein
MIPGQTLTKTGVQTGTFGSSPVITSVDSATQITITSGSANTAGAITFNVGAATDLTADGAGITIKCTTDKTFAFNNANSSFLSSEHLTVASTKAVRFNGTSNYVGFVAPASIASSVTWTLPSTDASTNGFALVSNGSGTLSWAAAGAAITSDTSTTTLYPAMSTSNTGNFTAAKVNANLVFNGSTNSLGVGTNTPLASVDIQGTQTYSLLATRFGGSYNTGLRRANGTQGSPTTVANGDVLHQFSFQGYDGASWLNAAQIRATVDNTVSTNIVPTTLGLYTTNTSGTLTLAMSINSSQNVTFAGTITESSSIVYKENVMPITNALDAIMSLVGVTYDRKNG